MIIHRLMHVNFSRSISAFTCKPKSTFPLILMSYVRKWGERHAHTDTEETHDSCSDEMWRRHERIDWTSEDTYPWQQTTMIQTQSYPEEYLLLRGQAFIAWLSDTLQVWTLSLRVFKLFRKNTKLMYS